MADMFGSPVGTSAYDKDFREAVHVGAGAIGTLSHARLYNAQAAEKEQEAAQQKELAALMAQAAGGGAAPGGAPGSAPVGVGSVPGAAPAAGQNPFSLSTFFNNQAAMAARAGLPKAAQELAKTASTLSQQEASTLSSNTTARLNEMKIIGERSEMLGQMFGGAKDESQWNRSNALFEFQTGQPSPFRGVPYSPQLATQLADQAVKVKDRLAEERRRLEHDDLQDFRGARLRQHATALDIANERLRLAREQEARLQKNGGKGAAGAPTAEELRETKRLMRLDGINTDKVDADSLNSTAFSVASRARELQQENRALGRQAAITRAFSEMKESGDLDIQTTGGVEVPLVGKVGGTQKFGRDPARALPAAAKAALKEGHETTFTNGQVWTLKGGKVTRVK